ncbi:ankyrin repeat domain-containing protein [Aspergillus glaucus CBS 516.65]|uniref:Uncharacterized protein n=1 Tax=Aspergillus glaucus CBS 516.65 TaxID=1160497 RepID=A0A1L9V8U8_ASPGL|nr:hypothetical protein ASPGLDRAFT_29025 [Aspergillus glaucus CBS 516.65]OJJ80331.1 hypothetical protein ASPGLDRAFT_29025 [Aspergillus glaucus CBS 516.65]
MLPFREAMDDERIETAKLLLDHMDLSTLPTDHDGQATFICIAAASGSETLVERLLKHGCDPEAIIKTCGDLATFGHVRVLEMLLDHGAALKYPYLAAVYSRQMQIVKLLLARGVDLNCWRSDGENDILSSAAADKSMFKFLLEHGADIRVDKDGDSLLREAILRNNLAVAGMVLDRRVKPEDERKVLERAATWDTSGVLALLFQRGIVSGRTKYYRSTKAVELALEAHNAPALKILLENGWCLFDSELYRSHQRDGSQDIIYHAFQARSPEEIESMLDILFSNGVQINRTVCNTTNIWFPILERDAYSLKLLLGRGADPLHLTEYNEIPLFYAVNRNFAAGIKLLLEAIVSSERISRRKLAEDVHFALAWALNGVKWDAARVLRRFYYHDLDGTALIAPPSHRQVKDKRDMDEQEWAMKYFGPDI